MGREVLIKYFPEPGSDGLDLVNASIEVPRYVEDSEGGGFVYVQLMDVKSLALAIGASLVEIRRLRNGFLELEFFKEVKKEMKACAVRYRVYTPIRLEVVRPPYMVELVPREGSGS